MSRRKLEEGDVVMTTKEQDRSRRGEVRPKKARKGNCPRSRLPSCSYGFVGSNMLSEVKLEIPVYQDVMYLFQFISYTGASTFVRYGEHIINPTRVTRVLRVFQQVACMAIFLLLLAMSIFEFIQFALVIWSMENIGEIIPNIIWMTSFPLAIMAQIFYTVQRPVLLKFFERWESIHHQYALSTDKMIERQPRPKMYYVYLLTVFISVAMVIVLILDFPILPFLPSNDQPIPPVTIFTNHVFLTCALFAITLFYAWNLSAASDLVPSMIYFHLAKALEKTGKFFQVKGKGDQKNNIVNGHLNESMVNDNIQQEWQKGWLYYEAVRALVHESNTRFGSMLLLNHGAMFFVASSNIFSILRWYRGMSWLILLVNAMNATATILRFTTTVLMCSKLAKAVDHLQSQISSHLAVNWSRFGPAERQFFTAFLIRVHDRGTIACPLGLYPIRPSILLAMLSLLVTYMIVLLQTSDASTFTAYRNFTGLITGTRFYYHANT